MYSSLICQIGWQRTKTGSPSGAFAICHAAPAATAEGSVCGFTTLQCCCREATLAITDLAAVGLALWAATADLTANHQIFTLNNLLGQQLSVRLGSIASGGVSCFFFDTMAPCRPILAVTSSIHAASYMLRQLAPSRRTSCSSSG